MHPTYAKAHPGWAVQVAASVERQRHADAARAATTYINTPAPTYSDADPPVAAPDKLPTHSGGRFRAAAREARDRYPGVVGEVLAEFLAFHAEAGWLGDPAGKAAKLAAHLLDQGGGDAA